MKILYVTTIGSTMGFFKHIIRKLLDEGNKVDIATNDVNSRVQECFKTWGCNIFTIPTSRSPFRIGNFKAINIIKKIAKNYDIVHCHTPLASIATRIGCKGLRKKGLRVIYTAHGFHFYKGAPVKNWLIYYPIELLCSKWTDVLITINKEDFELSKHKMRAKTIKYIPGVGIDISKFHDIKINIKEKKRELGLLEDDIIILSVGELNENKNHEFVIRALSSINNNNIHYIIAGEGPKKMELERIAKSLNVNLHLLGFRKDVNELYKISDLYILPSKREGLNVSLLEALCSNTPCLGSRIRGNVDVLTEEELFSLENNSELKTKINVALSNKCVFTSESISRIKKYDYNIINSEIINIYESKGDNDE